MLPMKKEGVLSIISQYGKPKSEIVGGKIDNPGEEVSEGSDNAAMKASMKQFISAIKSGDVDAACTAYLSLHEDVDEILEGTEAESEGEVYGQKVE